MAKNNLDLQQAIGIIDSKIHPKHLNRVQEIILLKSLEGKTYSQIAIEHNYGMEYIKTSGSELWKILSQAFGQQVTKSNCVSFIRRQISEFITPNSIAPKKIENSNNAPVDLSISTINQTVDSVLMASEVPNFEGRKLELEMLQGWSRDSECRFIMIMGMIGCGKTTLATQAAQILREQFHRVIFLSMRNSRELKYSLEFCLYRLNPNAKLSSDINKLLVDLALYLKKHRCLIVLDDLDGIIEFKQLKSYYRLECEQYAQFLRCLIASNHQSLIIATSRNKIEQLNFYSSKKLKFLQLDGLESQSLWSIFKQNIDRNISQDIWNRICNYYLHNPKLLKIIVKNFEYLPLSDENIFDSYQPYFEEIDIIIAQQLELFDEIGKEIIYWLAINSGYHTLNSLVYRINHPVNKILKVISFLKEKYMVVERKKYYILLPIYADYIQRYLIKSVKASNLSFEKLF